MPLPHKRPSLDQYNMAEARRMLRDLTGRRHALLDGRGATGIWAALRALGLRDKYVMIPANTCYIVLWAVLKSGNKPLLVDVDAQGNLNTETLIHHQDAQIAEKDIKAIIPCHMYGIGAGMAAICEWARANHVYVIEDAALALGGQADGRPTGSWGDVSVFSFGLGKIADNQVGGAVLTDDDRLTEEIEKLLAEMPVWDDELAGLTNQWNAIYWAMHQYEAENPRLLDLYPELFDMYGILTGYQLIPSDWHNLPEMLGDLRANLAHRAAISKMYDAALAPFETIVRPEGSYLWRYPVLVEADVRDDLLHYLWENGVPDATRWYPPLRYMTAALAPDITQPPTPNADSLGTRIINLRVDPGIDQAYAEKTVRLIQNYFST